MIAPLNPRVGLYYLLGALTLAAGGYALWPLGIVLFWPAFSLLILAVGYAGAGAAVYGKQNGRLPWPVRVLMAPALFGQAVSLRHYARHCRSWNRVTPGLLIGRRLNEHEAETLLREGVTAVLDLTAEFSEVERLRSLAYLNLPILDLTPPTPAQLRDGVDFIRTHAERGVVYVHCKIGYSRTAAFAAAYLMETGQAADPDEAMARLRQVRPSIVIRPEIVRELQEFNRK